MLNPTMQFEIKIKENKWFNHIMKENKRLYHETFQQTILSKTKEIHTFIWIGKFKHNCGPGDCKYRA
jgi:hypothetical protein